MQSFISTFQKHTISSDILILAVSGGVDSMVLLELVIASQPRGNIVVAHFDHSLRGKDSDSDRELVANICKIENISFESCKMNIATMAQDEKMNLEAMARRERYTFLEEIRNKYQAKYILTAHHSVDQTETVIGNMVKGAKVRGLSGMHILSGMIFRPLLFVTKTEIHRYAKEHNIDYREDSTNIDITYDRNRIRHDIIPVLESLNPSIYSTIGALSEYMQSLGVYLTAQIEQWLLTAEWVSGRAHSFLSADFMKESPFFQSEIISYLYIRAHWGSSQGLSRGLIDELIRFIWESGSYGKKEIKKLKLERRGERIIILENLYDTKTPLDHIESFHS